jgi:uncharacterized protein YkwD
MRCLRPTRTLLLAAAASLAASGGVASPAGAASAPCANADVIPTTAALVEVRRATLCLINRERTKRGRRALRSNSSLRSAAERYAQEMVRKSFFDHVSPTGSTLISRIRRTAYLSTGERSRPSTWALGENLAWGTDELATPAATVRGWMASTYHRRNILTRGFREAGIGVAIGTPSADPDGATYVSAFGKRSR